LWRQFLRCREAWLADIIDDLDPSNPYDYVKRLTDHHRVHLFDVVMQYRAIFADDTSNQASCTARLLKPFPPRVFRSVYKPVLSVTCTRRLAP
jgi:hypothetical protein